MFGIPGGAKQNSHWRIIPFDHFVLLEIIEIKIELSDMGVLELFGLQLNQNMAFQQAMIKDQVNIKMLIVNGNPFLARFETEPFPKFEQKELQMIKQGIFKALFQHYILRGKPKELENIWVPDDMVWRQRFCLFIDKPEQGILISRQAGAFIQQTADLPLKLPDRPVTGDAFNFVEKPFERIVKLYDFYKMAE